MRSKLMKGLALTSSILLFISFLCYRAGLFPDFTDRNTDLQTSPNGSSIQSNTIRKPAKPKDSMASRRMLPSSKVMVMADWKKPPPVNPGKQKLKPRVLLTEQQILSSSKSAILFRPTDSTKHHKKSTDTSIYK